MNARKEKVDLIMKKAPEHVLEVIASTVWSLCLKMNVPRTEAEQCVEKVRERQMGYWFENMEKMDIQEERRNTAEARADAEKARQEAERAKKEAEKAKEDAAKAKEDAVKAKEDAAKAKADAVKVKAEATRAKADVLERNVQSVVTVCKKHGISREQTVVDVMECCQIDQETAKDKVNKYWKG